MLIYKQKIECPNCGTKEWIHALNTHQPHKIEVRMVCHKCKFGKSLPLTVNPTLSIMQVKACMEDVAADFYIDLQAQHLEMSELEGSLQKVKH